MASSHDTRLVDRLYAFASALPLQHLNKPVPHFLLDVHDAVIPHIENLQLSLEERGWASVALPAYLSTLQARLAITGLIISLTIFLISAALPRGKKGETQKQEGNTRQEAGMKTKAVEEVVGEIGVEKQEIRGGEEVEELKLEREEEEVKLKTQPVPASPRTASITSTSIAAVIENPSTPVPAEATPASPPSAPATTTPASPVPVSQQASNSDVDPRSPRPAPSTTHRTSPIRTRSSTSSIPVRVPTTPARASSYPTAINTAVNHTRHASTPIARTATSPTSPASAKVVAASYAWVMSEDLEWDDRAGGSSDETGEHSDNSNSYSDDDDDDEDAKDHAKDSDSPHSRRSLEDELQAAGYKGAAAGELDDSDNDSDVSEAREQEQEDKMNNGALHPRRHSHTSDIEARYEAWRKTRSEGGGGHHHHNNSSSSTKATSSALGSGIIGIGGIASGMGGIRKTRSHHSRKDSVLENQNNNNNNNNSSPSTGRSSLSMSTRSMTRHALLQRKRSSALKPWARKRKEDFGEWLKKKTTTTTAAAATNATNNGTTTTTAAITSTTKE
ncbi:hypothetical protein IWZ03DRAFT_425214 [Phyllosticta citriasiana]|uniref:Uncharacterized protein n=1 Tax=Phyllosticta citriasiana TaxID=595635 RepID=A0ABR1KHR1_9PEZI